MKRALLLVDHGSTHVEANDMLEEVAALIRRRCPELLVVSSHMELAEPNIGQGIAVCAEAGVEEIVVHPYMLSPGRHATKDIPRMVNEEASKYPHIRISVTPPLGVHRGIVDAVLERCELKIAG